MSDLYTYLQWQAENKEKELINELLEELTHRLIACEQSIRRMSAQLDELQRQGGANDE
tara:strand:- start:313 stop:486 length:174 start_codon:yes stop_codon:yes gene_type:complete